MQNKKKSRLRLTSNTEEGLGGVTADIFLIMPLKMSIQFSGALHAAAVLKH